MKYSSNSVQFLSGFLEFRDVNFQILVFLFHLFFFFLNFILGAHFTFHHNIFRFSENIFSLNLTHIIAMDGDILLIFKDEIYIFTT